MSFDSSELRILASDLGAMDRKMLGPMREVFKAGADALRDQWRSNSKETAGTHGKHYPRSITAQEFIGTNIHFEVGPERGMKQGNMGPGFEYGSINQPPHLDGNRAADAVAPILEQSIADVLAGIAVSTEKSTDLIEYTTKAGVRRLATRAQVANWTRGSAA